MSLYSIILDAVLLIVAIVIIITAYKRGLLRSIILLVGAIASVLIAISLSRYIADVLFQNFIRNGIIEKINDVLTDGLESIGAATAVSTFLESLPKIFSNAISTYFGGEAMLISQIQNSASEISSDLGTTITDTVIAPILISLIQTISSILIFFICMMFVKMFSKLFKGFYAVPILGPINSFLGGAIGIAEAAVWIFIIVSIGKAILMVMGNELKYFNVDIVQNSYIFSFFYNLKFI